MNFSKLTQYLDSLQTEYAMPMGDLKIMQDHETIYRHRFGNADFAGKKPLADDSLYRLYSATKLITMVAVLQLYERGKISLTDPLSKYLPAYAHVRVADDFDVVPYGNVVGSAPSHFAQNPIRLIDLMTMSAGFSYDTFDPNIRECVEMSNGNAGTGEIIAALAKTPLMYEPGTRWNYSLAHDVLAAVVETVSEMRFSDYLKTNIFEPLGALDFTFRPEDPAYKDRICDIYESIEDTFPFVKADPAHRDTYCFTSAYESGGAGLIGSVESYSLITDALACGGEGKGGVRILKPETVAMFEKPYTTSGQLKQDFDELNRTGYAYGLGVRVLVDDAHSKSPVGEFGWDGAAGAYALVDTKNRLSFFYAEHVLSFGDNYYVIHPKIRDLVYTCLFEDK